ncbi:hypothetical protein MTO96_005102 [Rhipicephalus appendiculatus]
MSDHADNATDVADQRAQDAASHCYRRHERHGRHARRSQLSSAAWSLCNQSRRWLSADRAAPVMRLGPQLLDATRTHKQGLHRQESAGPCAERQQEPRQEVSCGALRQRRRLSRQAALRRRQPASRGRGRELRGRPDVARVKGTSRSSSRRHRGLVGESAKRSSTSRQAFHAQAPDAPGCRYGQGLFASCFSSAATASWTAGEAASVSGQVRR